MTTTCHLQILPDYYTTLPPRDTKHRPNTNPRYKRFNQIHFTAGDEQQFNNYRFVDNKAETNGLRGRSPKAETNGLRGRSPKAETNGETNGETNFLNDTKKNIKIDKNRFNKCKIPNVEAELYSRLDKKYVDSTFRYIFHKFKKGIFVKIHSNTLKVFLPFSKANFTNEWYKNIKAPPDFCSVNDFIKFACSLAGFNVVDEKINSFISGWYSNNFLMRHEFPPREGDSGVGGMKDMLLSLCHNRELPDIEFFINKRDLPLLKKDLTEPYESLYNDRKLPLLSFREHRYYPILSMTTAADYADIPMPTLEDWARVSSIEDGKFFIPPRNYNHTFNLDFSSKKSIAVFRGASTGEGTTVATNIRLKVAEMSSKNHVDQDGEPFLDAGITKWNTRIRKEYGCPYISTIDYTKLPFGLVEPLTPERQSDYKYIINIDGHCSAFRLSLEFGMGSVILLVESRYRLWFHTMIKPWIHYVPVKGDLSDLIQQIKWCKKNPHKCKKMAENSLRFYSEVLSKQGILDYMQCLLVKLRNTMGYQSSYNKYRVSDLQKQLMIRDLRQLSMTPDQKKYLPTEKISDRGGVQIYKVVNENMPTGGQRVVKNILRYKPGDNFQKKYADKYWEGITEIFAGIRCLNHSRQYIPNFQKINGFCFDSERITVDKDWVEGNTLDEWVKSPYFTFENFLVVLLQINLSLFLAQSLYGFIHFDLYPWNIVIETTETESQINYPWIDGKMISVKSKIRACIIDYGKSSIVYRGVRYGSLKYCTIHDTLTNLLSSLFEVVKNGGETLPILKLSRFVTNTKFRETPFKNARELRLWLKDIKKYDNMLISNKHELASQTSIDFIKYLLSNFTIQGTDIRDRVVPPQPLTGVEEFKNAIKTVNLNDKFVVYHLSKVLPDVMASPDIDFDTKTKLLEAVKRLSLKPEKKSRENQLKGIPYQKFYDMDNGLIDNKIECISLKYVKQHSLTSEIYFPNPSESMAIYSHSTFKFYSRLLGGTNNFI